MKGHQALLEYTDEEMEAAIKYDTEKLHINRDEKYGDAEFHIEYTLKETIEVSEERKASIISELQLFLLFWVFVLRSFLKPIVIMSGF